MHEALAFKVIIIIGVLESVCCECDERMSERKAEVRWGGSWLEPGLEHWTLSADLLPPRSCRSWSGEQISIMRLTLQQIEHQLTLNNSTINNSVFNNMYLIKLILIKLNSICVGNKVNILRCSHHNTNITTIRPSRSLSVGNYIDCGCDGTLVYVTFNKIQLSSFTQQMNHLQARKILYNLEFEWVCGIDVFIAELCWGQGHVIGVQ